MNDESESAVIGAMISRRGFLQQAGAVASASWIATVWPAILATAAHAQEARRVEAPMRVLTEAEAALLDAISAQILPSGDGLPGAREAGVVHFMDRAFETFMAPALEPFRQGLSAFDQDIQDAQPDSAGFASLPSAAQTALMPQLAETPLFGTIHFLTLAGMFADPIYGGNKDKLGWQLIGFEDRHVWQPPFGHYDATAEDD